MIERTFNPGDIVFREGDEPDGVYIVQQGRLRVYYLAGDREIDVSTLENGDLFGEIGVIEKKPRSASVRAIEPTVVDFVPADQFSRSFRTDDPVSLPLLRVLCARIRNQDLIIRGLKRPVVRKRGASDLVKLKLRGGNLATEDLMTRRQVTPGFFPWLIGRAVKATAIDQDSLRLADPSLEYEHLLIELRDGQPYVRLGSPKALAVVNDDELRWGVRETGPLQHGHNILLLGDRQSKLRLIAEVV